MRDKSGVAFENVFTAQDPMRRLPALPISFAFRARISVLPGAVVCAVSSRSLVCAVSSRSSQKSALWGGFG